MHDMYIQFSIDHTRIWASIHGWFFLKVLEKRWWLLIGVTLKNIKWSYKWLDNENTIINHRVTILENFYSWTTWYWSVLYIVLPYARYHINGHTQISKIISHGTNYVMFIALSTPSGPYLIWTFIYLLNIMISYVII